MGKRPAIPEAIKREVRKRCGFSCVICGQLIWEYEHMTPWAEENKHEAANITLLCRYHHGEVTAGRLSKEAVRAADEVPIGRKKGFFSSYDCELSKVRQVQVAGQVVDIPQEFFFLRVITYRGETVFSINFEHGIPLYSFNISEGGELVFTVLENEISYNPHAVGDLNFVGKVLQVKGKTGTLLLQMTIDAGILYLDYCDFAFPDCAFAVNRYLLEFRCRPGPSVFGSNRFVLGRGHYDAAVIQIGMIDDADYPILIPLDFEPDPDFKPIVALMELRERISVKGQRWWPLDDGFSTKTYDQLMALAENMRRDK